MVRQLREWISDAGLNVTSVREKFTEAHFAASIPTLYQLRQALRGVGLTQEIIEAVVDACTGEDHELQARRLDLLRRLVREVESAEQRNKKQAVAPHPISTRLVAASHLTRVKQDILPKQLLDREPELLGLTEVASGSGTPYAWWQGEPWAGKTALLSWFVLRHRPARVDTVAYFIAERLGTNDRDSFLRAVTDQLAAIAGVDIPPDQDRSPDLLSALYEDAAKVCTRRRRTLLLAVDGLDEDAGATLGGHSIAALLPKNPPAGLRVVVTGRPNMPVPADVPADHPLRDATIIRRLIASPAAVSVRDIALRELRLLLDDNVVGRHLVGLLAVARSGLTTGELEELLGVPPDEIDEKLRGISGRSLVPRTAGIDETPAGLHRHVLGHKELQQAALDALGRTAADDRYGRQLRGWAASYRAEGWPAETPYYLLNGYVGLLRRTHDTDGLIALALDPRRQLRLVARDGVDIALADLESAVRTVTGNEPADLAVLAAAAASRDLLTAHRAAAPARDAGDVARRGDVRRAWQLAQAEPQPDGKATAFADVARTLGGLGHDLASETARGAAEWAKRARQEAAPLGMVRPDAEDAVVAAALVQFETGEADGGLELLRTTPLEEIVRCQVLAEVAGKLRDRDAMRAAELLDEATEIAEQLESEPDDDDPTEPIRAWAAIAEVADGDRADRAHVRIITYARHATGSSASIDAPARAALALPAERRSEAAELAVLARRRVERAVRVSESPADADPGLGTSLHWVVQAVRHTTGDEDEVRRLVASMPGHLRDLVLDPGEVAIVVGSPPDSAEEDDGLEPIDIFPPARPGWDEVTAVRQAQAGVKPPAWAPEFAAALVAIHATRDAETLTAALTHPAARARAYAAASLAATDTERPSLAQRLAHAAADAAEQVPDGGGSARLGTPDGDAVAVRAYAAQALAYAGEDTRAVELATRIARPIRPDGTEQPAYVPRRKPVGQAHTAVIAGLAHHDSTAAIEFVDTELTRLLGQHTRLGRLAQVPDALVQLATLLAVVTTDPPTRQRVLDAIECTAGSPDEPAQNRMEDALIHGVLSAERGTDHATALRQLVRRTDAGFRHLHPEQCPLAGLAVVHALLGDLAGAYAAANRLTTPATRAAAFAAVAAHLHRVPAHLAPAPHLPDPDPTLQLLRILALSVATAHPDADAHAEPFLRAALAGTGWQHTLPVLTRIAPEAVDRIREITFTHLAIENRG
ncbi:hypothetical protein [Embleya sp. AB8]|uniref:hypothetical protein n=1 Tax=Embleya sp. AB8 TaxID=3156304 RepID=UPI003C749954